MRRLTISLDDDLAETYTGARKPSAACCAEGVDRHDDQRHERICLLLLEDAYRGLEDIVAGRTRDASAAIAELQERRRSRCRP